MFTFFKSNSPKAQFSRADSYFKKGNAYTAHKQFNDAELCYKKSVEILEPLAANDNSPEIMRALSKSYGMLGNLGLASTDMEKRKQAAAWFKKSLVIDEKEAERVGTDTSYDDLAVTYYNIGLLELDASKLEKALGIWQKLARQNPGVSLYSTRVSDTNEAIKKVRQMKK